MTDITEIMEPDVAGAVPDVSDDTKAAYFKLTGLGWDQQIATIMVRAGKEIGMAVPKKGRVKPPPADKSYFDMTLEEKMYFLIDCKGKRW